MVLVEYKLHKVGKNAKQAPHFIVDGGYHVSPLDNTMVGLVEDEADRDYYIPDTITTLTKEEFMARQAAIHAAHPMTSMDENMNETTMTAEEVTTIMEAWYDSKFA